MNNRAFNRKIAYLAAIALLLLPIAALSQPAIDSFQRRRPSIAVMPFTDQSPHGDQHGPSSHNWGGDHGGSSPIEGPNIPHVGEEFPSHGLNEAAELIGREAADDPETSVRTPSTDPRPDVGADPSNAIRIRFPRKRADEGHR